MMARWFESLFPVLEELHIGYVAFSPLANGFLTGTAQKGTTYEKGDYRGFMPQFTDEAIDANKELLELIYNIANEKQATPAQISLAWMINKKPYIVPIPGSRKVSRIRENLEAGEIVLSKEEVEALDKKLDRIEMSAVFGGSPMK
jgi:aryl-alcohol dehydrogenase-like predicted oxidoreductase